MACSSKEAKDSSFTPLESTEPEAGEGSWTTVGYRGAPNRTHPLYKKLSIISGQVNARTVAEVKAQLQEFGLCKRGIEQVLRKRLKNILRREALLKDPSPPSDLLPSLDTNPYHLDYLCLLDFEATCEGENPPDYIHEIIEFPVLLLNLKTLEIKLKVEKPQLRFLSFHPSITLESEFREYCRPCLNPVLSQFCKRLTGIRQDQVNSAPYFSEVFRRFSAWLETRGLGTTHRFAVVTDCPWDIRECLFPQCVLAGVPFPKYATKWIDMRKLFASFYQMKSGNLAKMLECLGMQFEGREHCGLDDTRNIARVVVQMIRDGCILKYNRFMPQDALNDFAKK